MPKESSTNVGQPCIEVDSIHHRVCPDFGTKSEKCRKLMLLLLYLTWGTTLEDLGESERVLAEFFKNSDVGLAVFDEQLRYQMVNPYLAASNGTSVESHVGKHVKEILGEVGLQVEPAIQLVFANAQPVMNCEFSGALPNQTAWRTLDGHFLSYSRFQWEGKAGGSGCCGIKKGNA